MTKPAFALTTTYPSRVAFITGAASGLGKELCLALAADGWTIGMADVNDLSETKQGVEARGGNATAYNLDITDKHAYKKVVDAFISAHQRIDVLVNNAGIGDGGDFEAYPLELYEKMITVNQLSVVYGCHYFIPHFKTQRSGHIINVASLAAISCAPQMGAYNMTKAAVLAISETLYGELMDVNVRVSCVMPAYFKTNIAESVQGGDRIKRITRTFIQRSGIEAAAMAREILKQCGKGTLYVLPGKAKRQWHLKRLMPVRFRKMVKEKYLAAISKIR